MASRTTCLLAVLALACLAMASAQCIECKDCKGSNSCLSMCKASCAPPGINIEVCKGYGNKAGKEASDFACQLTMTYCGNLRDPRRVPPPRVSLQQCANAAYGVCQSIGLDPAKSSCGKHFNGVAKCSKAEFKRFHDPIIDEQCNQKVAPFDKKP